MGLEADAIADRRQMRRKITFWRVFAFLAFFIAIFAASIGLFGSKDFSKNQDHIARVKISGFIGDDEKFRKLLRDIGKNDSVKALILHINSPGGTTAGSEALFDVLREVSEKKPITSVVGTLAASGGYIAAIGTDHIVARGNSITGSIGVIFQWAQFGELLEKVGVKVDTLKSSPLKAEPSFHGETPEKAREVLEAMILDSYDWFIGLVAERRNFNLERAKILGDGRVYTGRQALEVGLIDALGGEEKALDWLHDTHEIDKETPVLDWSVSRNLDKLSVFDMLALVFPHFFGKNAPYDIKSLLDSGLTPPGHLNGLVSVWQAPES